MISRTRPVPDGGERWLRGLSLVYARAAADQKAVAGRWALGSSARAPMGHLPAHQQRDERVAKAHRRGQVEQQPEVQTLGVAVAVDRTALAIQITDITIRLVIPNNRMR